MAFLVVPSQDTLVVRLNPAKFSHSIYWHLVGKVNGNRYWYLCKRNSDLGYVVDVSDEMQRSTIGEINADDLCPLCWPFDSFDADNSET